jgi:hypothetical protein
VGLDELVDVTGFSEEVLEEAFDELEESFRVGLLKSLDAPPMIFPENSLFWVFDPSQKGWNPEEDAFSCAVFMVNSGKDGISLSELEQAYSWSVRRVNPAATYLVEHGLVLASKAMSHPEAYPWIGVTSKTRRFAKSR